MSADARAINSEPPQLPTVQESTGIASILYAVVGGEITHNSSVLENYVPNIFTTAPYTISATLENKGNIHEKANFSIIATDVFSGQILYEDRNYAEFILPGTTRYTEREIDNLPVAGLVKITQSIHFSGGDSISEQVVLICPIWLMFAILVTLAFLVMYIVFIIRRHRHRYL